jgi:hypothetical protein
MNRKTASKKALQWLRLYKKGREPQMGFVSIEGKRTKTKMEMSIKTFSRVMFLLHIASYDNLNIANVDERKR